MNKNILNPEQINVKAPAVLQTVDKGAHHLVSDHYTFFTTTDVIELMSKLGWKVIDVNQQNSKKNPETCKHQVHFWNAKMNELYGTNVEISLTNSHDRTSRFRFIATVNNNITGNRLYTLNEFDIRHMGHDFKLIKRNIKTMVNELPEIYKTIATFHAFNMSNEDREKFALQVICTRYPEYVKDGVIQEKKIRKNIDITQLLTAPDKDKFVTKTKLNLWDTMNLLHDRMIKGKSWLHKQVDNKPRLVREVNNIRETTIISQGIWSIANDLTNG